jgi:hypothetical protein
MLELFNKYVLGELPVILAAPVPMALAVIVIVLLVWIAMQWRYGGIIEKKQATIDFYKQKFDGGLSNEASNKLAGLLPRETEKSQEAIAHVEVVALAAGLTPQTTTPVLLIAKAKTHHDRLRVVLEYSFFYRAMGSSGWTSPRQVQLADLKDIIRGQQLLLHVASCKQDGSDVWWGGESDLLGNLIQKSTKYRAQIRFIGSNKDEQTYRFLLLRTSMNEAPFIAEVFTEQDFDMKS